MTDTPAPRKRLLIRTWGCQMNVYDSARMADVLAPLGYAPTEQVEEADMVILNTCHIREKATEKVFSDLGRLREAKQAKGGDMVIAVAGCVAQAEGAEITARAPWVDIVLGPQSYHRLPEMVARASRAAGAVIETEFPPEDKFDHLPETTAPQGATAFLTIQEGCDKFCSFCVVPYTRGSEYSRPVAAIVAVLRDEAFEAIQRNPYRVAAIKNVGFVNADKVGTHIGVPPEDARRISAALSEALDVFSQQGHTYAPASEIGHDDPNMMKLQPAFELVAHASTSSTGSVWSA